ncbi:MAG: phenylalanine--tRNA ligase subunit beta [Candidatus Aenigmarchaeota archaeon]|nr:phenylalanine--tRNA ligase subunit beta [Candidatus Aenigmarchaeota archaeon]
MPVININRNDFCRLIGHEIPMKTIEERIPMLGVGWEGTEGEEFSIEVFPNRPDMLSVEGLARAFSSFMNIERGLREYKAEPAEEFLIVVQPKVMNVRPFIVSCVVKNVDLSDDLIRSVIQMQEKLHVTHCRKRKKAAIGIYDLEKISFPLTYTTEKRTFKYVPLEEKQEMSLQEILEKLPKGKDYAWILEGMNEYPILLDSRGKTLSFIPILNADENKIDNKTKNLFIEVTGTDEKTVTEVLNIIISTFGDRGAKMHKVKIKYPDTGIIYTPNTSPKMMSLEPKYVNKILGLNLRNYEIIEYLQRMGHDAVEINKENIEVTIPIYRTDIMHAMDIVEDVAIAFGYENFEAVIPNISTIGEENPLEVFASRLRSLMVGHELQEVFTFILTNKKNLFNKMNVKETEIAETANPKTEEYNVVRNWLLPSLIEILERNQHHEYPQNIFEVGDVVILNPYTDTGTETKKRLALAMCHSKTNFAEIKSIVESMMKNLGINNYKIEEAEHKSFVAGRCAKIGIDSIELGVFGEINPVVLENWKLEMPVSTAEIDIDLLQKLI